MLLLSLTYRLPIYTEKMFDTAAEYGGFKYYNHMKITRVERNGSVCAVVESTKPIITNAQSALDLLMDVKYDVSFMTDPISELL